MHLLNPICWMRWDAVKLISGGIYNKSQVWTLHQIVHNCVCSVCDSSFLLFWYYSMYCCGIQLRLWCVRRKRELKMIKARHKLSRPLSVTVELHELSVYPYPYHSRSFGCVSEIRCRATCNPKFHSSLQSRQSAESDRRIQRICLICEYKSQFISVYYTCPSSHVFLF